MIYWKKCNDATIFVNVEVAHASATPNDNVFPVAYLVTFRVESVHGGIHTRYVCDAMGNTSFFNSPDEAKESGFKYAQMEMQSAVVPTDL